MNLTEYNKKRDFTKTSEPKPEEKSKNSKLVYVVQKHAASHLHYDFRIEADGVLKSWAVPKGPSMNYGDKRLAIMVEDHPLEYAGFKGKIPEGNYGAGTVEIWDSGTWKPRAGFENVDKALENGLLEFNINGDKLKGEFALVEMKHSTAKNGWLLVKKHDKYATDQEYDANDIKP